jgi:hypothetical protein
MNGENYFADSQYFEKKTQRLQELLKTSKNPDQTISQILKEVSRETRQACAQTFREQMANLVHTITKTTIQ